VQYEDYAALEASHKELVAALKKSVEHMRDLHRGLSGRRQRRYCEDRYGSCSYPIGACVGCKLSDDYCDALEALGNAEKIAKWPDVAGKEFQMILCQAKMWIDDRRNTYCMRELGHQGEHLASGEPTPAPEQPDKDDPKATKVLQR
jgi:hypothetical protein